VNGEHDAVPEEILPVADQAELFELFFFITRRNGSIQEAISARRGKTQAEFLHHIAAKTTPLKVTQTNAFTLVRIVQLVFVPLLRELIDQNQSFFHLPFFPDLLAHLLLLQLDVVFRRYTTDGVGIGKLLQSHQKLDGITTFPTTKALGINQSCSALCA